MNKQDGKLSIFLYSQQNLPNRHFVIITEQKQQDNVYQSRTGQMVRQIVTRWMDSWWSDGWRTGWRDWWKMEQELGGETDGRWIKSYTMELREDGSRVTWSHTIEDEEHFVTACEINESERKELHRKIDNIYPLFKHMNEKQMFLYLMSKKDRQVQKWFGKFIYHSFITRNNRVLLNVK